MISGYNSIFPVVMGRSTLISPPLPHHLYSPALMTSSPVSSSQSEDRQHDGSEVSGLPHPRHQPGHPSDHQRHLSARSSPSREAGEAGVSNLQPRGVTADSAIPADTLLGNLDVSQLPLGRDLLIADKDGQTRRPVQVMSLLLIILLHFPFLLLLLFRVSLG